MRRTGLPQPCAQLSLYKKAKNGEEYDSEQEVGKEDLDKLSLEIILFFFLTLEVIGFFKSRVGRIFLSKRFSHQIGHNILARALESGVMNMAHITLAAVAATKRAAEILHPKN